MFRHITAGNSVCVFNCKQVIKKDKEMFMPAVNLNTGFYVITALVTVFSWWCFWEENYNIYCWKIYKVAVEWFDKMKYELCFV